jgi:hypothetical protein
VIFNSENSSSTSADNARNITIGESVIIKSTLTIPTGKLTNLLLKDEIDHRLTSNTNSGFEHIKTDIVISGGDLNSNSDIQTQIQNIILNSVDNNQHKEYDFGTFTNVLDTPQTIEIYQYLRSK